MGLVDLSGYRLNDELELCQYRQKMGDVKYLSYQQKVFTQLSRIKPGEVFQFTQYVKTENIPLFIKLCCLYILEHPRCVMTDDYMGFRHLK